jgi:uracil-DNA glycosylase family 4
VTPSLARPDADRAPSAPVIAVPPPLPAGEGRAERARALADLHAEMAACQRCVVAGYLASAESVAGYRGRIGDRVLLVGQAPGHLSVERGRPFSGPGGRALDGWLQRAGFAPGALHREVYISALTRCDPGKNPRGGGDRKPSPPEVALCRPFLLRELELVRPRAVLLVGGMAIAAFVGPARLEDVIGSYVERNGVYLLPLPHPSGVSRWLNAPEHQALLARALERLAGWRGEWLAEECAAAQK